MNMLTPEERARGRANFNAAISSEFTRRDFLLGSLAAGVVSGAGLGAFYFGYGKMSNPLPIGIIGTGDEGGVLMGALTPSYVQVTAICDIRPYNIHRAFHGDHSSENALLNRPGLMAKYGWKTEDAARKVVTVHTDYKELLKDPNIKGVIIALPLHLHDSVAIEAMRAGKHVLTEKLMGQSIARCKNMGRVSKQTKKHLATGHQRHYSILYDNAVNVINNDLIGDIHHIRAQWHRGNLPGKDSWQPKMPDEKMEKELADAKGRLANAQGAEIDVLQKRVALLELMLKDKGVEATKFDYREKKLANGKQLYDPLKELIQWRLWERTGAGLMAELGSHQLDAAGIFCSARRKDHKKARPLSVIAVGGRHIFPEDREVDDHVYCNYEFPAPTYDAADPELKHKKIVVTYSSINGNGWGGYGEIVMGTNGTIVLETESDYQLYAKDGPTTFVDVVKREGSVVLDTTASAPPSAAIAEKAIGAGPVSRGYTEEIEHWAYCIEKNPDAQDQAKEVQPKCRPEVAMSDAIIALTTNIAIRKNERIEFKDAWFEIDNDETPEGDKPTEKA